MWVEEFLQNFSHIFQLARWISKPTLDRPQIFSNNTLGEIENLESYFSSSLENLHSPRWSISSFCIIFNDWGGLRKSMKWAICKKSQINLAKKGKCWRYLCTKTEIILDPYSTGFKKISFIGVVVWEQELKPVSRLILQVNPPSSQLRQIGTHHWQQQLDILLPLNTHIFRNMNNLIPIFIVKGELKILWNLQREKIGFYCFSYRGLWIPKLTKFLKFGDVKFSGN